MVHDIYLERRYQVEGYPDLLPYTLAKKHARYPEWCVSAWHEEAAVQRPAVRDSNLCFECVDLLRAAWASMAAAWPLLQDMVHPSQQFGNGERVGGGSVHPPLPINVQVSDLLRDIRDSVASVVQGLIEDCPDWRMPASPTTDVLADQLSRWKAEYVASHPRPGHAWSVLREAWFLGQRIARADIGEHAGAEVETQSACRKRWAHLVDGKPVMVAKMPVIVECDGMIIAVQPANGGAAVARCDAYPEHAIPFDVWLMVRGTKAKQKERTAAHLVRRFGDS